MVLFGTEINPFQLPDMASFSSTILLSQEEFHLFHSIDRKLYSLLVTELWRDPLESMQAMALWLWLERAGFSHIIKKILSLPHTLINALADEAVTCLNTIANTNNLHEGTSVDQIPLTENLMKKEISIQFFQENKALAITGIAKVGKEVCIRALADIVAQAVELTKNARNQLCQQLTIASDTFDDSFVNGFARLGLDEEITGEVVEAVVPAEERTMFVTFSKGYPVEEYEVRDFFTRVFGDCIDSFYMQEVKPTDEQALFARIVFYWPWIIDVILNGVTKAKFNINGKHVWMRKFVAKPPRSTASPPPSPPQNPLPRAN